MPRQLSAITAFQMFQNFTDFLQYFDILIVHLAGLQLYEQTHERIHYIFIHIFYFYFS